MATGATACQVGGWSFRLLLVEGVLSSVGGGGWRWQAPGIGLGCRPCCWLRSGPVGNDRRYVWCLQRLPSVSIIRNPPLKSPSP